MDRLSVCLIPAVLVMGIHKDVLRLSWRLVRLLFRKLKPTCTRARRALAGDSLRRPMERPSVRLSIASCTSGRSILSRW